MKNIDLGCGTATVSWLLALAQMLSDPETPPKHCLKQKQSLFIPTSLAGNCRVRFFFLNFLSQPRLIRPPGCFEDEARRLERSSPSKHKKVNIFLFQPQTLKYETQNIKIY